jgi:hypothetical protein
MRLLTEMPLTKFCFQYTLWKRTVLSNFSFFLWHLRVYPGGSWRAFEADTQTPFFGSLGTESVWSCCPPLTWSAMVCVICRLVPGVLRGVPLFWKSSVFQKCLLDPRLESSLAKTISLTQNANWTSYTEQWRDTIAEEGLHWPLKFIKEAVSGSVT